MIVVVWIVQAGIALFAAALTLGAMILMFAIFWPIVWGLLHLAWTLATLPFTLVNEHRSERHRSDR